MVSRFDSNRLAEIFKRPTTFGDYCDHVADCSNGEDEAAARAPVDASERGRYFIEGVYTGHFRYTEANNCTLHPDSCTGHIVDYP